MLVLAIAALSVLPSTLATRAIGEASFINVDITPGAQAKTTDAYAPNPAQANVGDTVIWTNRDSTVHTATSGTASVPTNIFGGNASDVKIIAPSGTQSFTFTEAGDYPYFCVLHPMMVGSITVAAGSTPIESKATATLDNNSYEITAMSTTSIATAAEIDAADKIVTVTFDKAGEVELTLPKTMISGIPAQNGVMADDKPISYQIVSETATSTVVKVTVPEGSTEVDIQGSFVVPEFPVIAALVLGITVAAVVTYTRFSKGISTGFGRV